MDSMVALENAITQLVGGSVNVTVRHLFGSTAQSRTAPISFAMFVLLSVRPSEYISVGRKFDTGESYENLSRHTKFRQKSGTVLHW